MNGRAPPGRDALGSLLSGFSGLEGDVLGRPKTMQDQKKKLQASRASPVPPAPPQKAAAPTGDPFNADDLDQLVQSRRAASSTSMVSSKPSVGSALDDFDALFGGPISPVQPNVAPGEPAVSSVPDTPYQPNSDLLGTADNEDDLLGVGLGSTVRHAPPTSLQENERRPNDDDDGGLLPGFGPAIFSQQQEPESTTTQAASRFDPTIAPSNDEYVSDSFPTPPPQYDELYKETNGSAAAGPRPSEKSQRGSLWSSGVTTLGEDRVGSDRVGSDRVGSDPAESDHDLWAAPRRPAPRPPTALESDEPQTSVTADLTQRAQRAFQSSAAWFARASRKVQESVRELQERRAESAGLAGRLGSRPQTPGDEAQAFYRDWAAQIEAQSPRTRSAMLGALSLDDRVIVERILDERNVGQSRLWRRHAHERHHSEGYSDMGGSDYYVRETVSPHSGWASNDDDSAASPRSVQETSQHLAEVLRTSAHHSEQRADDTAAPESGVRNGASRTAAGPPARVPNAPPTAEFDLMGLGDDASTSNNTTDAATDLARPSLTKEDHIAAMFSTEGVARPVTVSRPPLSKAPKSSGVRPASAPGHRPPVMVDTRSYEDLYSTPVGADEAEPEERRRLREARLASRHAKMAASLAEARERESTATAEKEERVRIRESLIPQMEAWTAGKKDNIRALLSTMHTVLWEGSDWTAPSIADMVEEGKVKRWYMKANLVVHPDKVRQKGGTAEAIARADMIFDILKAAWGKFEAQR